ncbi:unnamed protein product [Ophioblennius macclurei]
MASKGCPAGFKWDHLLVVCVKENIRKQREHHTERPLVVVEQLRASVASVMPPTALTVGPALWSCVALVMLGSILALAIWFFIYRKQRRPSSSPEASESGQELLLKTEAPAKQPATEMNCHAEVPSPCHQQNGFTAHRGPATQVAGLPTYSSEHRIPLPATELGGTILVTTKTM